MNKINALKIKGAKEQDSQQPTFDECPLIKGHSDQKHVHIYSHALLQRGRMSEVTKPTEPKEGT